VSAANGHAAPDRRRLEGLLLLATTNRGKLREIQGLLAGLSLKVVTLQDRPALTPPAETGHTFAENARLKARYYAEATSLLTVAEDSGLEIDRLGGAPGVESARFGGIDASYPEKFSRIYAGLRAGGATGSAARFVCALALVRRGEILFEARGTIEGEIATEPRGDGGFGYDPIFFYPPFGCTLAEAGERKSLVSHRTRAFSALRRYLQGQIGAVSRWP
jgi:XTP/dITP diphosphohydrolase